MLQAGFSEQLNGQATNADGDRLHRRAYSYLRDVARLHIAYQLEPKLQELEKPYAHRLRAVRPELRAALEAAGEELVNAASEPDIDLALFENPIRGVIEDPFEV